jgi:hypothetical protein
MEEIGLEFLFPELKKTPWWPQGPDRPAPAPSDEQGEHGRSVLVTEKETREGEERKREF